MFVCVGVSSELNCSSFVYYRFSGHEQMWGGAGSDCDLCAALRSSPGTPADVELCIKGNVHPNSRTVQPAGRHLAALSGGSSHGRKRSSALKDIGRCP